MHYNRELPKTSDRFGNFDRVRVDAAETSFFEGREFLLAREFSIAAGASLVLKIVTTKDTVVHNFDLTIDEGWVRFSRKTGGTEGGSFTTPVSLQPVNAMTGELNRRRWDGEPYELTTVVTTGGTLTGGSEFDIVRLRTSNATAQQVTVGGTGTDHVGAPAGTRYYVLTNLGTGTCTGVLRARYEERSD